LPDWSGHEQRSGLNRSCSGLFELTAACNELQTTKKPPQDYRGGFLNR